MYESKVAEKMLKKIFLYSGYGFKGYNNTDQYLQTFFLHVFC